MKVHALFVLAVFLFLLMMSIYVFRNKWFQGEFPEKTLDVIGKHGARQSLIVFEREKKICVIGIEKNENKWETVLGPFDASNGRNGFAGQGEKREGDGKTPSGLFDLKLTFGYEKQSPSKMPYIQVSEDDIWVDDPNSQDYNTLVKRGQTDAKSFEDMKRKDDLYSNGVVIEYNTQPAVKGLGSAIFLHIWAAKESPTSGCVALEKNNLLKILKWLDPDKKPVIMLGQI